jgi:hypothetical protein
MIGPVIAMFGVRYALGAGNSSVQGGQHKHATGFTTRTHD